MDREKLRNSIKELVSTAQKQDYNEITRKIKELVPEYVGGDNWLLIVDNWLLGWYRFAMRGLVGGW